MKHDCWSTFTVQLYCTFFSVSSFISLSTKPAYKGDKCMERCVKIDSKLIIQRCSSSKQLEPRDLQRACGESERERAPLIEFGAVFASNSVSKTDRD